MHPSFAMQALSSRMIDEINGPGKFTVVHRNDEKALKQIFLDSHNATSGKPKTLHMFNRRGFVPTTLTSTNKSSADLSELGLNEVIPSSLLATVADTQFYAEMMPSSSSSSTTTSPLYHLASGSTNYSHHHHQQVLARNSTKTLKCPKCNWHYKYQETLEIHMKEKHFDGEVNCAYCTQNQPHPKLARGESYSCGYKPYRCDLCKYSTTTKGNLSIHMQSDKHLNALNELPPTSTFDPLFHASNANYCANPNAGTAAFSSPNLDRNREDEVNRHIGSVGDSTLGNIDASFYQCLICSTFRCSDVQKLIEHLEKDRSFPHINDIQIGPNSFHCNLCPYMTNLKANFQLHTRTDKHLQRVQLINHMREGWSKSEDGVTALASMLSRLAAIKSVIQVRCHLCQETFSCNITLHEHFNSPNHLLRVAFFESGNQNGRQYLHTKSQIHGVRAQQLKQIFGELFFEEKPNGVNNIAEMNNIITDAILLYSESAGTSSSYNKMISVKPVTIDATNSPQLMYRCEPCEIPFDSLSAITEHLETHKHEITMDLSTSRNIPLSGTEERDTLVLKSAEFWLLFSPTFSWDTLNGRLLEMKEAKFRCARCKYSADHRADFEIHNNSGSCNYAADIEDHHRGRISPKSSLNENDTTNSNDQNPMERSKLAEISREDHHGSARAEDQFAFGCSECQMTFSSSFRLSQHKLQHMHIPVLLEQKCPVNDAKCANVIFKNVQELCNHLRESHPGLSVRSKNQLEMQDSLDDNHSTPEPSTSKACMNDYCITQEDKPATDLNSAGEEVEKSNDNFEDAIQRLLSESGAANSVDVALQNKILKDTFAALSRSEFGFNFSTLMNGSANAALGSTNLEKQSYNIKSGADLWRMLSRADIGTNCLLNEFRDCQNAIENIPHDQLGEILAVQCHLCRSTNPFVAQNIWLLDNHFKEVHEERVALYSSVIQDVADRLNDAIGRSRQCVQMTCSKLNGHTRESHSPSGDAISAKRRRMRSPESVEHEDTDQNDPSNSPVPTKAPFSPSGFFDAQHPLAGLMMSAAAAATGNENFFTAAAEVMKAAVSSSQQNPITNNIKSAQNISIRGSSPLTAIQSAQKNLSPASATSSSAYDASSPQKRARTRITDDQLKILRQYFDINNSPSEEKIKEMSAKAQLPEKVIKHWFRNTLFKERQRDKDSPYNFNIPPQMSIDLAIYEKTGEAKITSIKQQKDSSAVDSTDSMDLTKTTEMTKQVSEEPSEISADESAAVSPNCEKLNSRAQSEPCEDIEYDIGRADDKFAQIKNYSDFLNELTRASNLATGGSLDTDSGNSQQQQQQKNNLNMNLASFLNGLTSADPIALSSMLANTVGITCPSSLPNALLPMSTSNSTCATSSNNNSTISAQGTMRISPTMNTGTISCGSTAGLTVGSGRRANRTRFTDFQLRTLQNFFDRQAYPKDDDLEMLSKKLGLSPRVIVVWFQNARQKARKISENHSASVCDEMSGSGDGSDRPPSLLQSFQCKKCCLSFPQYVDLLQHQQKACFASENMSNFNAPQDGTKDSDHASTSGGINLFMNPFLDGLLAAASGASKNSGILPNILTNSIAALSGLGLPNNESRKLSCQVDPTTAEQIDAASSGEDENNIMQNFLKMITPNSQNSGNLFHAILPFINEASKNQISKSDESVSNPGRVSPLDLSVPSHTGKSTPVNGFGNAMQIAECLSGTDENDVAREDLSRTVSTSPYAPSTSALAPNIAQMSDLLTHFAVTVQQQQQCQSLMSAAAGGGFSSDNAAACAAAAAAAANSSKRYRTHLTPLQVYIMKALFNDYKTPSMSECDALGREIGLHKRVVQVWFQNARAKERKSRGGLLGSDSTSDDGTSAAVNLSTAAGVATRCELCALALDEKSGVGVSIQDHIFTSAHIRRVKEQGLSSRVSDGTGSDDVSEKSADMLIQNCRMSSSKGVRPVPSSTKPGAAAEFSLGRWPYHLVTGFQEENLFDQNIIGTPISMLQIPESVMHKISADLACGLSSAHFTQDGLEFLELREKLSEDDYKHAATVESEVGWACTECTNVFQHESLLRNHQKMICRKSNHIFRLVQTHYTCNSCNCKTGTQEEFRLHCETNFHKMSKRKGISTANYLTAATAATKT